MQILHVKHEHSKHAYTFKEKKGWWDKLLQQADHIMLDTLCLIKIHKGKGRDIDSPRQAKKNAALLAEMRESLDDRGFYENKAMDIRIWIEHAQEIK